MKIIKQDLLQITEGVICHQVNLIGVAGGLAGKIFRKYPLAFSKYKIACENKSLKLGMIQPIMITKDPCLILANLAGQLNIGTNKRQTNYEALKLCFSKVNLFASKLNLDLYIPYLIGCGLGGGDWQVVSKLIEECCPYAIICQLD